MPCSVRNTQIALFLAMWLLAGSAVAESLTISAQAPEQNATSALLFFEDPEGLLTFDDVRTAEIDALFASHGSDGPQIGFTPSAWWVKLTLSNPSASALRLYLRQDYPLIDELDVWVPNASGGFVRMQGGDRVRFSTRPVQHRNALFPIELAARSESTVYLRFASDGPINIGLSTHLDQTMIEKVSVSELGIGLYFGGFLVLVFYNMFIFAAVRDRTFIFYLLYLVSYGAYFAVHNGIAFQHLWPNSPWLANQSLLVLLAMTLFFGLMFSMKFLNIRERSAAYLRIGTALLGIIVVAFLSIFVLPYQMVIVALALLSLATTVLIIAMGLSSLFSGYRPARYFMLAWSALLIGVVVYMLKTFGLLPHNTFTHYGFQIGSLIEMTLLSVALSSRVNDMHNAIMQDPLTGVGNRRQLNELLDLEFERAQRTDAPLALIIGDIDNFKQINDTHGHSKGDEIIHKVATFFNDSVRKQDTVCRYGGEEFAIVMPNTNAFAAEVISKRLLEDIERSDFGGVPVTISAGLCSIPEHQFDDAKAFFDAADQALYDAKLSGRNRVMVYRPGEADSLKAS
ncbi:MAG: diguanylate cyclase [Pseudomonadota bacterium]